MRTFFFLVCVWAFCFGMGDTWAAGGWPSSDRRLDYVQSLDIYASLNRSYFRRLSGVPLVGVLAVPSKWKRRLSLRQKRFVLKYNPRLRHRVLYKPTLHYRKLLRYSRHKNYTTRFGTYISGGDCVLGSRRTFPRAMVSCYRLPKRARLGNTYKDRKRFLVDLSNRRYASAFARQIVREVGGRKRPFLFLDNIRHPSSGLVAGKRFSWRDTTRFLYKIRRGLNRRGTKLIANVSVSPWVLSRRNFRHADMLARGVDGMAFELPLHQRYARPSLKRTKRFIAVCKRWLKQKKLVLLLPVQSKKLRALLYEKFLLAAFAMLMRNKGDSIFVDRFYWKPRRFFPWWRWPRVLGNPTSSLFARKERKGWRITRRFSRGKVTVVQRNMRQAKRLRFPSVAARTAYRVLHHPSKGRVVLKKGVFFYVPKRPFFGTDGVVLQTQPGAKRTSIVVLNITVRKKRVRKRKKRRRRKRRRRRRRRR